jgi:hypothetical protein
MDTPTRLRRLFDMYDILGLDSRKKVIVCPLPGHQHANFTPSFHIFIGRDGVQKFQCHGNCQQRGDVIDLVGFMSIPGYDPHNKKHTKMAMERLTDYRPTFRKWPAPSKPGLSPNLWREYLPLTRMVTRYAHSRGLDRSTLEKFKVGSKGDAMAIPVFEDEMLRSIKFRNVRPPGRNDPDYLRYWSQKGSASALLNYDAVKFTTRAFLLVKGEIPVMLLDQLGITACCTTNGEAGSIERWKDVLVFSENAVVVGDNDRDPHIRERMQSAAHSRAKQINGTVRFPPPEYKDIDEWILADTNAISAIKSWLIPT